MVDDIWEEGEEFFKINTKIKDIQNQKTELDNMKKKLKKNEKEINQKKVMIDEMNPKKVEDIEKNTNISRTAKKESNKDIILKSETTMAELMESELNDQMELIEFNKNLLMKVLLSLINILGRKGNCQGVSQIRTRQDSFPNRI